MSLLPVGSEQPVSRPRTANLVIIAINVLVFLLELIFGDPFVLRWSFTPADLTAFLNGNGSFQAVLTIFTAMFMHGGLSHIFGNMLFLWVFGQAVEAAYGSRPYVLFYLTCGVVANLTQYAIDPTSTVPNLGASGAIAGVMGGYLAMYPSSRIDIFVWPLSVFIRRDLRVPAWIMLGLWFGLQVFSGFGSLASSSGGAGVAYFAHVGGFVIGFLLALALRPGERRAVAASY
jgi:membrane associated rhomboid family serine protease